MIKKAGKKPLGYYYADGKILIDNKEKIIIQYIFDTFLETQSLIETTKKVNVKYKNRQDKEFTKQSIDYILKNPFYIGKVKHKLKLKKGTHKTIIELKIFKAIQKVFKSNEKTKNLEKIKTEIIKLNSQGMNKSQIAKFLNFQGFKNSNGKDFTYFSVSYFVKRYATS